MEVALPGPLAPAAFDIPNELSVSRVLNRPALIIARSIEWATVLMGYEQATQYTVYDEHGNVVALMAEETGVANWVARQVLRTRRPFKTTVLSADGSEVLFKVSRPAYLISSSMTVLDAEDEPIGEVKQRWHPWRRNYDLYLGKRQMAAISGTFLAWEFELKDDKGATMALIDRNFQGFAKELFTDAGKYVIHFGFRPERAAEITQATLEARSGRADLSVTPMAVARTDVAVIPSVTGNQLVVQHPLALDERMITLACAIAVDYDYFSRHSSHGGGILSPPIIMPMPVPGGGVEPAAEGPASTSTDGGGSSGRAEAAGAAGAPGAAAGSSSSGADAGGGVFGGDSGGGFGEQDAGSGEFGDGGGSGGVGGGDESGWSWDGGGASSPAGDEEGGVMGTIKSIWEMINGD